MVRFTDYRNHTIYTGTSREIPKLLNIQNYSFRANRNYRGYCTYRRIENDVAYRNRSAITGNSKFTETNRGNWKIRRVPIWHEGRQKWQCLWKVLFTFFVKKKKNYQNKCIPQRFWWVSRWAWRNDYDSVLPWYDYLCLADVCVA